MPIQVGGDITAVPIQVGGNITRVDRVDFDGGVAKLFGEEIGEIVQLTTAPPRGCTQARGRYDPNAVQKGGGGILYAGAGSVHWNMGEPTRDELPRFLVDENAARLGRWLRLLGYDAASLPGASDAALIALAAEQARVLLTRDRGIMVRRVVASGAVRAVLLDSDDTWQQLEQVVQLFQEAPRPQPFTRCATCNGLLQPRPREAARPHVPPFIAATQQQFMQCSQCGRYYWRGTHWQRVTARLARLGLGSA